MKKYVLLNRDTLESEGVLVGTKKFWRIAILALIVLVVAFMGCFLMQLRKNISLKEKLELNENVYTKNVDSLQCAIDYSNTMVEECNLHSFIGQL